MVDGYCQISYDPCPPDELAGRKNEKPEILDTVSNSIEHGQVLMISGTRRLGKTSLLDWTENMIQRSSDGFTIKNSFLETPGNIFNIYKKLLYELKGYESHGTFNQIMANQHVRTVMRVALKTFDNVSGVTDLAEFMQNEDSGYDKICSDFLEVLNSVSNELVQNDKLLAILIDDVHWSSELDFKLLKDIIRKLPLNISIIFTYNLQEETKKYYNELQQEFVGFNFSEIQLGSMNADEIKEFAMKRCNLIIRDPVARFLSQKIGDPLTLVVSFNLLNQNNLEPTIDGFEQILPEALTRLKSIYKGLDSTSKSWANSLCVLESPMPLDIIACMLDRLESIELKDNLEDINVFRTISEECYDFRPHALREYCKERLPKVEKKNMYSKAAKCCARLEGRLPTDYYTFSIAEHTYESGQDQAFDLNYELGKDLQNISEPGLALKMNERAVKSAENMGEKELIASAISQKGEIFESMFRFDEALDSYKESWGIYKETGNLEGEAKTSFQMGKIYEKDSPKDALDHYEDSLKIYKEIGNLEGEAKALSQIDKFYDIGKTVETNFNMNDVYMTDVIKRTGEKELFRPEKIRLSLEKAMTDAGFTIKDKISTIEHISSDAMNLAIDKEEIHSKDIRDEILNDLESDVPEAAQAWRTYERRHEIRY